MQKIRTVSELKLLIQELEIKQELDWQLLKNNFTEVYLLVTPLNIFKELFNDAIYLVKDKGKSLSTMIIETADSLIEELREVNNIIQFEISSIFNQNADNIILTILKRFKLFK